MSPDFFHSLAEGLRAALWLALLWVAVGLDRPRGSALADRLRDALVLGTALPFALALVGLLDTPAAFAALGLVAVVRRVRARPRRPEMPSTPTRAGTGLARGLPALVALGVAWPALVRPPDSGDTLWYHLPNAAAWVRDGGLWQTTTHYWWYPGGSELFAAGLMTAAGPLAAGLAGTAALLLLGTRIATWLRAEGVSDGAAGALGAAVVATFPLAAQGANLGNDVWLAAAFLETLWCGRSRSRSVASAAALCALIKPYGVIFAVAGLMTARAAARTWLVALAPLAVWVVRDAILWKGAVLPPAETAFGNPFATTIAGNLPSAPGAFATGFAHAGIGAVVFFALGLAALVLARDRRVRVAAAVALGVFLCEPFGFRNDLPQLATGESLRFAAPFFAVGAVGAAGAARRFPLVLGGAALLVAAVELSRVLAQFWFVPAARLVLVAMAIAAVAAFVVRQRARESWSASVALALAAAAVAFAASEPAAFYDAWASRDGVPSHLFTRLASRPPAALVVAGVHAGPFAIVLPTARVADARKRDPCAEAAALRALIVTQEPPAADADDPAACGPVLERDGAFALVNPTEGTFPKRPVP